MRIDLGENNIIEYLYTAAGTKLRQSTYKNSSLTEQMDYVGNFIYQNKELAYILAGDGRLVAVPVEAPGTTTYKHEYFLTDHLGNTRVTFTKNAQGQAAIVQEDHYYPYGMVLGGQSYSTTSTPNPFLYNGKELDKNTGYYQYGFRQYDAEIGRWHVADALAEKYYSSSPYAYVLGNPVGMADVLGLYASGYTTSELGEINNILRYFGAGGSVDNFLGGVDAYVSSGESYNGYEIVSGRDGNSFGINVIGSQKFVNRTNAAIAKIGTSKLGYVALSKVGQGSLINPFEGTPLTILEFDLAPANLKKEYGGAPFYSSGLNTIFLNFYEDIPSEKHIQHYPDGFIPKDDFLILGHEIWHAYIDRVDENYDTYSEHFQERASTGFENYLADVFEINHIRRYYRTHDGSESQLWDVNIPRSAFNPYQEKVGMFWNIPAAYGGNSLYTTPSDYLTDEFYFYHIPKKQ